MRHLAASLVLIAVTASAPVGLIDQEPPLPRFSNAGELVVLTRNSPTTRYLDADGNFIGLEHDLVELFARDLGVPVRYVEVDAYADVLPRLEQGQAHMAAAGLSITPERANRFLFSPPYMEVQQVLVYNSTMPRPRSVKELESKLIEVVSDSSGAEHLRALSGRMPKLVWAEIPTVNPEDLLMRVSEGNTAYAVAGSHIVDVARNFYPNIAKGMAFGNAEKLAWAFPQNGDPLLVRRAREFFARITADGTLKRLMDRYYGHVKRLERSDLDNLFESVRTRLPDYRPLFHEAQELTGLDWRFVAALAFQESHWDPLATSPTGVRGMMMLTSNTADRLGVKDRLDARQSILAGAQVFRGPARFAARPHRGTRPHLDGARGLQPGARPPRGRTRSDATHGHESRRLDRHQEGAAAAVALGLLHHAEARLRARRRGDGADRERPHLLRHPDAFRGALPPRCSGAGQAAHDVQRHA